LTIVFWKGQLDSFGRIASPTQTGLVALDLQSVITDSNQDPWVHLEGKETNCMILLLSKTTSDNSKIFLVHRRWGAHYFGWWCGKRATSIRLSTL